VLPQLQNAIIGERHCVLLAAMIQSNHVTCVSWLLQAAHEWCTSARRPIDQPIH
jgi:hypothetical protein